MKVSTEEGFSLIEVLVSIFVLAVGVIGAAGMQLAALHTSQQSQFQTRALHLAAEMADRMRANVAQMKLSDEANPYLRIDHRSSAMGMEPASASDCYGSHAQCDAQQLAQFEIIEWLQRITTELPSGRARVCRDTLPWDAAGQQFDWECRSSSEAPEHATSGSVIIKIGWKEKSHEEKSGHEQGDADTPRIALLVAPHAQ